MAKAAEVKTDIKRSVVLPPGRMKLMEYAHPHYCIHAPAGAEPEDVAKSDFYSLCCDKMRPFDFITVLADDGSWLVEAIVKSCGKTWAQVHVRSVEKLGDSVAPDSSQKYKVEWKGPESLWCVIRLSDAAMLQDKLKDAREANAWMADHENKVG